jgi:hypothetical protein
VTGVHVPEQTTGQADPGVRWDAFAASAPELAEAGLALLDRTGSGRGLLATVRADAPPRINPVSLGIVEGRLLVFVIIGSAKDRDLLEDGRYALHAQWDPAVPHEFLVRGHVREVDDGAIRDAAIAVWPFEADDSYRLYELLVDSTLLGERASDEVWPPVYRSWRANASG